jgi:hypothetical protein
MTSHLLLYPPAHQHSLSQARHLLLWVRHTLVLRTRFQARTHTTTHARLTAWELCQPLSTTKPFRRTSWGMPWMPNCRFQAMTSFETVLWVSAQIFPLLKPDRQPLRPSKPNLCSRFHHHHPPSVCLPPRLLSLCLSILSSTMELLARPIRLQPTPLQLTKLGQRHSSSHPRLLPRHALGSLLLSPLRRQEAFHQHCGRRGAQPSMPICFLIVLPMPRLNNNIRAASSPISLLKAVAISCHR